MLVFNQILLFLILSLQLLKTLTNADEINNKSDDVKKLLVITVATQINDGFLRFNRSLNEYGLNVEVLGLNSEWKGGDVSKYPGGGHKVNLLRDAIYKYKDNQNLILLFVDSYDVVFTGGANEIVNRFIKTGANVLFSSEGFCWPDNSLAAQYPTGEEEGKQFLNSGGFIGYAPQIYEIVSSSEINNLSDDQLFYTKIYLDDKLRKKVQIKLDHRARIFQNLNGAVGDVEIRFTDDDAYIHNIAYQTNPLVIHGNGVSKIVLNSLGNYLAKSWHPKFGCLSCNENQISLKNVKQKDYPTVLIGIFIVHATPFIIEFFESIAKLKYNKKRINVFLYNSVSYHLNDVQTFIDEYKNEYESITLFSSDQNEWQARNTAITKCVETNSEYYFSIDSDARITNTQTLIHLIEQNKKIIAPVLVRPNQLWSNFWGALTSDGFYSRSHDYIDIVKNNRRGVWNVPYIAQSYLINGSLIKNLLSSDKKSSLYNADSSETDIEMAFCKKFRDEGVFMFVSNLEDYGHLVTSETFDTSKLHADLYEIYSNQIDWQNRYIHENYSQVLTSDYIMEQPCPDVYWFPVLSPIFCKHLIDVMENFGKWSDGTNQDTRLSGGYENVPTRDIHMNQVGFDQHWLYFLREYIRPVQEKIFIGYFHDPPKSIMNFVVRYNPSEQPSLRPHHDSSTYTINIALNRPNVDFEGGGCRFIRYNCSITNLRLGWSFIHPGRLTHYHEGLQVTNGTRYIMISFVDP